MTARAILEPSICFLIALNIPLVNSDILTI
jgi:hypothetical protein